MKLLKKVGLLFFRYTVIVIAYFSFKFFTYKTLTVNRGVVVAEGNFKYSLGRRDHYYSKYPIVAFTVPSEDARQINIDSIPSPFDEAGNQLYQIGNIHFTKPPPEWHLDERTKKGDSADYYYKKGDVANAYVLSFRSYWITESAIYWMIITGIIWTVIVDLRRIGRRQKLKQSS